ncbi:MAG: JAB-like toxin 1 domain-containing protein, partial [Dysgonomonas sp.]|nr:JAB-like toxin 1 domain-containing protein [Dysgonomonas sp.]
RILIDGGYIEGGTYHFYAANHLGNNHIVADASGAVTQMNHYYPFGTAFAETSKEDQDKQPYKYNGKELDQRLGLKLYDYSARHKWDFGFTTLDPHAENYYSWSPYVYVGNNPLNIIDPTGMDTININEKGQITQHIKSKDRTVFNITDKDGNVKTLNFEYTAISTSSKTIKHEDGSEDQYTFITMFGDKNGEKVFEFMAKNLSVTRDYGGLPKTRPETMEWSLTQYGQSGKNGINIISTTHEAERDGSGSYIAGKNQKSGFDVRRDVHSHPYSGPSDIPLFTPSGVPGGKRGDIPSAAQIKGNNRFITPIFQVYSGYLNRYKSYNGSGIIK